MVTHCQELRTRNARALLQTDTVIDRESWRLAWSPSACPRAAAQKHHDVRLGSKVCGRRGRLSPRACPRNLDAGRRRDGDGPVQGDLSYATTAAEAAKRLISTIDAKQRRVD